MSKTKTAPAPAPLRGDINPRRYISYITGLMDPARTGTGTWPAAGLADAPALHAAHADVTAAREQHAALMEAPDDEALLGALWTAQQSGRAWHTDPEVVRAAVTTSEVAIRARLAAETLAARHLALIREQHTPALLDTLTEAYAAEAEVVREHLRALPEDIDLDRMDTAAVGGNPAALFAFATARRSWVRMTEIRRLVRRLTNTTGSPYAAGEAAIISSGERPHLPDHLVMHLAAVDYEDYPAFADDPKSAQTYLRGSGPLDVSLDRETVRSRIRPYVTAAREAWQAERDRKRPSTLFMHR